MADQTENLNEQVIVAFFATGDAADAAGQSLMRWDKANEDIKLGALARLTLSEKGEVESKRFSQSKTQRDALIGGAVGLVAGVLTGGLSLLGGALIGGGLGAGYGAATKGSLGLSEDALANIKEQLGAGRAALVVLCDEYEVAPTLEQLRQAGGDPHSFGVSIEVLHAIHEGTQERAREEQQVRNMQMGGLT